MAKRYIYFFEEVGEVEKLVNGDRDKVLGLLGGKGGNLAWIAKLGVPVPKGFTITTEACNDFYKQDPPAYPPGLWEEQTKAIARLEEMTGKKFGSAEKPLLVSCRSGAKISMPGMMDTVLNIGLNDVTVQAMIKLTNNPRFVYDSYRRLLQGFGAIVLGIPDEKFEAALHKMQKSKGYKGDNDCKAEDWDELAKEYKKIILEETGNEFPQDPIEQVKMATLAVFSSWNCERAIDYRNNFKIPHNLGTAVNIMSMVFGNMGDTSATGVAFTRNPSTGERKLWGEYLINAQGEDVVAGVRTADKIESLETKIPSAFKEFVDITAKLEAHFKDMQDVEFTIEEGKLWMLQTRNGKRTATAAVKVANEMVQEGLITKEQAVNRISPAEVDQLLHPHFDANDLKKAQPNLFTKGVNASPGAGVGKIYFSAEMCKKKAKEGEDVIMVRQFTKPDDIGGMLVGKGVITAEGGAASHAAVVARQLGFPAVVGCGSISIDFEALTVTSNGVTLHEGDVVSVDGTTGQVFKGAIPLTKPNLNDQKDLQQILKWADEIRSREGGRKSINNGPTRGLMVWANADSPVDAQRAIEFGAEGIGLCRTEHMFLGDRAAIVRKMILADNDKDREAALDELEHVQTQDFVHMFKSMSGLPTIIRLIDPPLHEFLPEYDQLLEEVTVLRTRKELGAPYDPKMLEEKEMLLSKAKSMHESNPMIGTRGVRLCLVIPGLVKMQISAILEGVAIAQKEGANPLPEIMVPLTMDVSELQRIKPTYNEILEKVQKEHGIKIHCKFGTMIEVPRAALTSGQIATLAEFYSFGTNDLHQMTLGLSRDDSEGSFLQNYYEWGLFKDSPFQTIDQNGVGRLMKIAVEDGRVTRPDLSVGICGEHGGDPKSIDFCHRLGMNYVSCSPFRIPIARLAAAQAVIRNPV
ncbi:pyruvate, phosphate dikinase family protein [Trichomonas vaginalis G3]|uniref:Pyruvate, phosphate dikinase n=1 Tax=Trichomonas vaginalis (strain ATCC PRA-98 / G3) TaxID=412133 RepID=A2DFI7_TRIV3|nr:pyruvate, phosphate dikinase protein [Trichomonas vaginalis G3]EAY20915.1 pyruvate, phosphate dikinase family protein [Trichomonas vaginalis G3]KAI5521474.1 pyruvate, phosphate dikinase protein [Trichomonas vaginalis G3]|eukprot:XP_001581901.1 pyruvate, phosphate dikinase family protein [Trichomonas vaginalis G3]